VSLSNLTVMVKCMFVKISFSSPCTFIFRMALVSRFLSFRLEFFAINRNNVFMHDASDAAKISSGTKYPFFPPNSGGGLTVVTCLPLIIIFDSDSLFHLAVPSNTNCDIKKEFAFIPLKFFLFGFFENLKS